MATTRGCPRCGSAMREIVWGYGTIADVADAGDVVIGGCVVDVDGDGRVAALQCPICDTRTDAAGIALEAPRAPDTTAHPFDVSFSSPTGEGWEVTMTDSRRGAPDSGRTLQSGPAGSGPGGVTQAGGWRERVEPYASREDALPSGGAATPDHVEPYAARTGDVPTASGSARDRVDPYASRDDVLPHATGAWQERIEPFAGDRPDDGAAAGGRPAG